MLRGSASRFSFVFLLISFSLLASMLFSRYPIYSVPHECRFWAMTADASGLPEPVVMNHLINGSFSLKSLGAFNRDGWGLAYYNDTEPTVLRGRPPASSDSNFDSAVRELCESRARIGVGHVRIEPQELVAFQILTPSYVSKAGDGGHTDITVAYLRTR